MRENGYRGRVIGLAVIGMVSIVLIGIVLVGLITGNWPWTEGGMFDGYTGVPSYSTEGDSVPEDSTQLIDGEETTLVTVPGESTTGSNSGSSGNSGNSGNSSTTGTTGGDQLDFDSLKPSTAPTTAPTEEPTTAPTTKPGGDVEVDIPLRDYEK